MTPDIFVLGRLAHHDAKQLAQLVFPYGEAAVVCDPDQVWPRELRCSLVVHKGLKPLRGSKRLAKLELLEVGGAHWVLRRAAAEAIARLLPEGDVSLVPAPLCDGDGFLDGDWALLDVHAYHPLDRQAATFTPSLAGAPHASLVAGVERVAWSELSLPTSPLFRVSEAPELLCVRRELAERILDILGAWATPIEPPYDRAAHGGKPCAPVASGTSLHQEPVDGGAVSMPHDEVTGLKAREAYERIARGVAEPDDRATACASPIYAYHLARSLDRAPSEDSRAGAIAHPRYATLYARDVDRGPRDDTRAGALVERFSAYAYLCEVELARHAAFEPVLGAATIDAAFAGVPALRARASPPPERFPASWLAPPPPSDKATGAIGSESRSTRTKKATVRRG